MPRPICSGLILLLIVFTTQLAAQTEPTTLSVVPLAEALQNPELAEQNSKGYEAAVQAVSAVMLNRPEPDTDEAAMFREHLADLARHRETRVGKLFFGALRATPDIENLPPKAESAGMNALWPLALGASIRVRAGFAKSGEDWLISELELTVDGVAGAPIAGMAPYFGSGEIRPMLLDLEAIDYVVGRDADDRTRPESERKPFDYDKTLAEIFEAKTGAVQELLTYLGENVRSDVLPDKRVATLRKHLATDSEREALEDAKGDPEFWKGIYAQLKNAAKAPRPAAAPLRTEAKLVVRWRVDGKDKSLTVTRLAPPTPKLEHGELALRGTAPSENPNEEGDGSGN